MILVVDTSVAVKWYVEEDEHEKAKHLLFAGIELLAPYLLRVETANVLRRKVRLGEITQGQAVEGVRSLDTAIRSFLSSSVLIENGLSLSAVLDNSVYDFVYLAAVPASDRRHLVSTDRKFAMKAAAAGYGDKILSLDAAYTRLVTGQENDNG